jgi:hypothetical protein
MTTIAGNKDYNYNLCQASNVVKDNGSWYNDDNHDNNRWTGVTVLVGEMQAVVAAVAMVVATAVATTVAIAGWVKNCQCGSGMSRGNSNSGGCSSKGLGIGGCGGGGKISSGSNGGGATGK